LFSLTKALETKGVKLSSQGQLVSLIYGPHEICFDKVFKNGYGRLLGIDIHPNPNNIAVTAQNVDINIYLVTHTLRSSLLQHINMVSRPRILSKSVPTVSSPKPNRKTFTRSLLIRPQKSEGRSTLTFLVSLILVMVVLTSGFSFKMTSQVIFGATF
jgi:hypothetical protein